MSNYQSTARKKRQNLIIVEGNYEKNQLAELIFKCFPELNIKKEDVWIYETNIYLLYKDIEDAYGENWAKDNIDIDLPFVISKKKNPDNLQYKNNFNNIILVFDYERHDPYFREEKILEMQEYFTDAADNGKLYINYPMVESYLDLYQLPDNDFSNREISVSLRPGKKYKTLIKEKSIVASKINFLYKLDRLLERCFHVRDVEKRKKCCDKILQLSSKNDVEIFVEIVLQEAGAQNIAGEKNTLINWVNSQEYINTNQTYWNYVRNILKQIIWHNISKANKIQFGQYQIPANQYKEYFERLDLTKILEKQNLASRDAVTGFIWVLNTCLFFIAEYNFKLIED